MKKHNLKKGKIVKARLPIEGILALRKGGAHSTKRGGRGYNRRKDKAILRYELDNIDQ